MTKPYEFQVHRAVHLPPVAITNRLEASASKDTGLLRVRCPLDLEQTGHSDSLTLDLQEAIALHELLGQFISISETGKKLEQINKVYLVSNLSQAIARDECSDYIVVAPDEQGALKYASDLSGFESGKARVLQIGYATGEYTDKCVLILASYMGV